MPQLVKGGKYVFGWSRIADDGCIKIPDEAVQEYKLSQGMKVFLISASRTSGGFVIAAKSKLDGSSIGRFLVENPELNDYKIEEGDIIAYKNRKYGWTTIQNMNVLKLSDKVMEAYGIRPGDALLSARGSNIGISLIVKGPIVEYARKHPEIKCF